MDLRWRMAVVTGAATALGREVALRFGRVGAGVVAVDADAAGAEETAVLVRARRVQAWAFAADVGDDADLELLAARLRDLGGADVLVHAVSPHQPAAAERLTRLALDGLPDRRGPASGPGAVVLVAPAGGEAGLERLVADLGRREVADRTRVMCVWRGPATPDATVAAAVLDLAARGSAGAVVDLRSRG